MKTTSFTRNRVAIMAICLTGFMCAAAFTGNLTAQNEYDVYVLHPRGYWKNGVFKEIKHPDNTASIKFHDITVVGNDVYLCGSKVSSVGGYISQKAFYCKNGVFTDLTGRTSTCFIEVQGDDIYVVGRRYTGGQSFVDKEYAGDSFWKNGQETVFIGTEFSQQIGFKSVSIPFRYQSAGIAVDGEDVYIAGTVQGWYDPQNGPSATQYFGYYYKNNELNPFESKWYDWCLSLGGCLTPKTLCTEHGGGHYTGHDETIRLYRHTTGIHSVVKSGNDIYYAGYSGSTDIDGISHGGGYWYDHLSEKYHHASYMSVPQITYWKNGEEKTVLKGINGNTRGEALDIKVVNGKVYVLAFVYDYVLLHTNHIYDNHDVFLGVDETYGMDNHRLSVFADGVETVLYNDYNYAYNTYHLPGISEYDDGYSNYLNSKGIFVGKNKAMSVTENGEIYVAGVYREYTESGSTISVNIPKLWKNGVWTDLPPSGLEDPSLNLPRDEGKKVIVVPRVGSGICTPTTSDKLSVYPNPTNDILNVELFSPVTNGVLTLIDVNGKVVLSQAVTGAAAKIDLSQLAAGNYILRLVENGKASAGIQVIKN